MNLHFKEPDDIEFEKVCDYIREFELDNRGLQKEQFITAFRNKELVGFGRLREHADCIELCSLGVIAQYRRQGIGKAITAELIKKNSRNIYLVCIIPEFFTPFGFCTIKEFPDAIKDKVCYCTNELVVPETYVAMLLKK